jgi:hypothetical protein
VHTSGKASVLFWVFFGSFLSFKSPVGLLLKDITCKVQKVKVKVQKDIKKANWKRQRHQKTTSKRQSNDTFPDALPCWTSQLPHPLLLHPLPQQTIEHQLW